MEEVKVPEEYKRAFNQGYKLRAHMPEVVEGMNLSESNSSELTRYFQAGIHQFEID